MWPHNFYWRVGLAMLALLTMGQSCTVNIGDAKPQTGGFYRSDDGGKTWRQKVFVSTVKKRTTTIAGVTGQTLVFDPGTTGTMYLGTREHGIWKTTNRGERWIPTSLKTGPYSCIAYNALDTRVLFTVSGTIVLKSTDAGQTWNTVYQESQAGHTMHCVAVDPVRPDLVWAFTSGGKLLLSENAGSTWTLKNTYARLGIRRIIFDEDGSGAMTIFGSRGIWHIGAGGAPITNLSAPLQISKNIVGTSSIYSVSIISGTRPVWLLGTAAGPLESLDRGATWKLIPSVLKGNVPVNNITINPKDPREIFFTVGQRLHHTIDHGQSWSVTTLPSGLQPLLLSYDPRDSRFLYYGTLIPLKE